MYYAHWAGVQPSSFEMPVQWSLGALATPNESVTNEPCLFLIQTICFAFFKFNMSLSTCLRCCFKGLLTAPWSNLFRSPN